MPVPFRNQLHYRERILQKFQQIINYPVTVLLSPPGYGKSDLLAHFSRESNQVLCWVGLESKHRFLKEFLNQLTNALQLSFPQSDWQEINEKVYPAILFHESAREHYVDFLKKKIESIGKPFILILDQYHHVDESSFIHKLLNQFIEHIPSNLHLLITTRLFPSGEAIRRLQNQNRLLEINDRDLRLTTNEMEILFKEIYQYPLSTQDVEQLGQFTLGWNALIHHCYLLLSRGVQLEQILLDPLQYLDHFFEYVEEEIIKPLPSYMQGFLYDISIFEKLDVELLQAVFQGFSKEMLQLLEKYCLLSYTNGQVQKELHPLLKKYFMTKGDSYTHQQLHRRVFYYYLQKEEYAASIPHLVAAKEWEELAYLLSMIGGRLVYLGHHKVVIEGIEALPSSYKTIFSRIYIVEGDYYRLHSHYSRAVKLYQQALALCKESGDLEGELLAIEGEVRVYLDTVKPNRAQALLKNTYNQRVVLQPEHKARIIQLMAENYINIGRPRTAKRLIKLSSKIGTSAHSEVQESRLYLRTGQLQAANVLLQKREESKLQTSTPLIHGFREGSLVHSLVNVFMGNAVDAKRNAQQGILLGTKLKSPFIEAAGWARMGHAMLLLAQDDFKLAEECYLTSLQIFNEIGIEWGQAEPLMGLAMLHGKYGNYELSIAYGHDGLRIAEAVSDNWMYHMIRICLGVAAYQKGKYQEAEVILIQSKEGIKSCGDHFLEAILSFWLAHIYYQLEREEAYLYFTKCLSLVGQHGYEFIFTKISFFGPLDLQSSIPLLLEVQERPTTVQLIAAQLLKDLGFSQIKFHPGYTLKIETFGGFRVWLGGRELQEKDWQRINAKRLFQYLITKRKQEILKEVIQLELWPDLDEETLDRDFKVALNALTKALEPDRKARSNSFYIIRNGSAYRLNPQSGYQLDVDMFEQKMMEGINTKSEQQARESLQMAFQMYKGEYLVDNLYEDWTIEERERLQVLYLRGSERLARLFYTQGEYEQAIKIAEKILEKDPCWEEAYRIIMLSYFHMMNRTMALRWYEKCRQNLYEELGIEPMLETQKIKEHIQKGIEM